VWALVLNIQQGLKQLATSPVAVGKIYRTIRPVYSSHSDSRPERGNKKNDEWFFYIEIYKIYIRVTIEKKRPTRASEGGAAHRKREKI
jgi:hypothetical protein